jgi:Fe-S oxidoreductase
VHEVGLCETKCPYNLPIRELIEDNLDYYENIIKGETNLESG